MSFLKAISEWFKALWSVISAPPAKSPSIPEKDEEPKSVSPHPWLDKAKEEEGVSEFPGEAKNPRISEYHAAIKFQGDEDDSWCASFAGWCLIKVGLKSTGRPNARSYLSWGIKLLKPVRGCVVVFWRESKDSWKGHVGFYVGETTDSILCYGGNQDNKVCEKAYPKDQVLGYFWPSDYPLPEDIGFSTERTSLSWEHTTAPRPERKAWSDELIKLIDYNLQVYAAAEDIRLFIPSWDSLSRSQKIKAIGEFWVSLAYFESGFNPSSASVDVGKQSDRNTWSIGLYQMSVVDQANLGIKLGYTYDELLTPIPNIRLAHAVMIRQIQKFRKIALNNTDKGRYWAVILHGNRFSKINEIRARMAQKAQV